MNSPLTVLLIDAAAAVRMTLAHTLTSRGYRVYTAAGVLEAEAFLRRLGAAAIHLVIADIHLTPDPQECEGYTLYRRWQAPHPTLPFLLTSGDPGSRDLPAVRQAAVHFLGKPFRLQELLGCVQELLGTRSGVRWRQSALPGSALGPMVNPSAPQPANHGDEPRVEGGMPWCEERSVYPTMVVRPAIEKPPTLQPGAQGHRHLIKREAAASLQPLY
jgi:CheY-like chemotaxis protein